MEFLAIHFVSLAWSGFLQSYKSERILSITSSSHSIYFIFSSYSSKTLSPPSFLLFLLLSWDSLKSMPSKAKSFLCIDRFFFSFILFFTRSSLSRIFARRLMFTYIQIEFFRRVEHSINLVQLLIFSILFPSRPLSISEYDQTFSAVHFLS